MFVLHSRVDNSKYIPVKVNQGLQTSFYFT